MFHHRHRQRQPTRFEASRRICPLFLNHNVLVSPAANDRRPPPPQRPAVHIRQHRPIPPHTCPAARVPFARDELAMLQSTQLIQVVPHIERSSAFRANCLRRFGGNCRLTPRTLKIFYFWHILTIPAHQTLKQPRAFQILSPICRANSWVALSAVRRSPVLGYDVRSRSALREDHVCHQTVHANSKFCWGQGSSFSPQAAC